MLENRGLRRSPASVDPFLEVRGLRTDRGGGAVAGKHERGGVEPGEEPAFDRADDRREVATWKRGVARTTGEQRVPGEEERRPLYVETDGAGGVAGRGDRTDAEPPDLEHRVVFEELVVGGEHAGVLCGDRDRVAGVADRGNRLDVVPVTMGLDHLADAEALAEVQQVLMLVGGVHEERLTGSAAAQDVDVVVHRAHDGAVQLARRVLPDAFYVSHHPRLAHMVDHHPMNFAFSEEQDELREAVRRFLADKSPSSEVRRLMATTEGYNPAAWRQMADELGLQSLAIPEEHGGSGFSFVELVIVLEEMGAALLCAPFLSSVVLAANALLTSGDKEAKARWLPGIASGETIATLALTEDAGRWDLDAVQLVASPARCGGRRSGDRREPDGWTLHGHKSYVVDGHVAALLLVVARMEEGLGLFAVRGDASGLVRMPLPTMDQTRKQARVELAGTPAQLVGSAGQAGPGITKTLQLAAVALAAEQVGGAQHCLDSSVEYAKARIQFGRPIGSFQAIKHKCADLLLEVESARSAAYYAGWAAAQDSDELPLAASVAKSYCSETYFHAAAENIQIHGGIGFTWEHDAHLYLKRAKSSELLFGDPVHHRELLARRIGI